jgi:exosome complex component RRP42
MEETMLALTKERTIAELKQGTRADGRALDEYRKITIKTGISKNADGSAQVRLGETEVLAGVKLVPGTPYPDSPDKGTISVSCELLSLASPEFEAGPPNINSIEIGRVVDRSIRESKTLDFGSLCVREGELVWIAFIDLYAINNGGNLFDACNIAAFSALKEAKFPKLEDDKIVHKEHTDKRLELKRVPVLNTFAKVSNILVADPSLKEMAAADARFSVATTDDGYLAAFQKGGGGSFKAEEISKCIDMAFVNSEKIRKQL